MIRPLAALISTVASLFKRGPRRVTREMALPVEGPKPARLKSRRHRYLLQFSFTRFLARKPIGAGSVGVEGAAWRRGLEAYQRRWAEARANSATVRLGRRAQKASSRAAKKRRAAAMRRLAQ